MAMKPKNTGAALRTQTASWQYDSADYADGMVVSDRSTYKELSKYSGNQHGGSAEGNFGRAAANLKGNTGATANRGPKKPAVDSVPAFEKFKGANDKLNFGGQERTPGGTRPFDPSATENYRGDINKINFGRGPTKGNAQ